MPWSVPAASCANGCGQAAWAIPCCTRWGSSRASSRPRGVIRKCAHGCSNFATCQKLRQQLRDKPGAEIGVDLESQTVTGPDGATYRFEIDANHKERLLQGLDDIGLVMQNIKEIEAFEKKHHAELPWLA